MYTLLVIDMQRGFLERFSNQKEKEKVVDNCRRVVVKAIADGAEIIDINYREPTSGFDMVYGPTIPEIRNLWKRYSKMSKRNVKKIIKDQDGGGFPIIQAEPQHKIFYACGINLGACVSATVDELRHEYDQEVFVIEEAVANCWGECKSDLERYERDGILVNMS